MSEKKEYQNLFSQYATEVGNYLPRRKRKDIQLEILSLLEDTIEDRSEEAGRPPDEEMAIEVLKKLGPPITFAQNFQPSTALVGPDVFPLFRWALILTTGIFLLQFVIGLFVGGASGEGFLDVLDSFLDKGFQFFGLLVFVFALLERTVPSSWLLWPFREMERTWDPAGLIANRTKQAVKSREVWFDIFILAALVILVTAFPQWVGVGISRSGGEWSFVSTLSDNFRLYQPWIAAYLLAKMVFNIMLVRQAYWNNQMRWIRFALRLAALVLLFSLKIGPDMFGLNPAYLAFHSPSSYWVSSVEKTLPSVNSGFQIYLVIQLVISGILAVRDLFQITSGTSDVKLVQF